MSMRPEVTYTLYGTSSGEQTGYLITFAQFKEGNILTETHNDAESGDESNSKSLIMNKQDMENLDSNKQPDYDLISTDMLEDILDGSQTHPNVNRSEARYQGQLEWKGALKYTQSMRKV